MSHAHVDWLSLRLLHPLHFPSLHHLQLPALPSALHLPWGKWTTVMRAAAVRSRVSRTSSSPPHVQGLPRLGPRGERGRHFPCRVWGGCWWSLRVSHWRTPRLPIGEWLGQRRCHACPRCHTLVRSVPPQGPARWIGGRSWRVPWRRRLSQRRNWKFLLWKMASRCREASKIVSFRKLVMLYARLAVWCSTLCNDDVRMFFKAKQGILGRGGAHEWWDLLSSPSRMLHIGRARHTAPRCLLAEKLAIECVDVGGWLANGDLALASQARFSCCDRCSVAEAGLGAGGKENKEGRQNNLLYTSWSVSQRCHRSRVIHWPLHAQNSALPDTLETWTRCWVLD